MWSLQTTRLKLLSKLTLSDRSWVEELPSTSPQLLASSKTAVEYAESKDYHLGQGLRAFTLHPKMQRDTVIPLYYSQLKCFVDYCTWAGVYGAAIPTIEKELWAWKTMSSGVDDTRWPSHKGHCGRVIVRCIKVSRHAEAGQVRAYLPTK